MTLSIPDFSRLRVLVAGDAMLDEYWFGDTGRISPEAPVPVVRTVEREQRPGGAANVALNLAALGADATLAAIVGEDAWGRELAALLAEHGVRGELLRSPTISTIHKLRVLSRNQQLIRLDSEHPLHGLSAQFSALFAECVAAADVVVFSDYAKGTLSDVGGLIGLCHRRTIPVLVDPKGSDFERYRGATVLTPNQHEFEAVVGACDDERTFLERGEMLRVRLDLRALLVTRGEAGVTLFAEGEPAVTLAAEAREVFDVTGAGDTVLALMAASIAAGLDYEPAAALANLGAGLVVGKIGVATVSPSELRMALHRRGAGGRGTVDADQLDAFVAEAKARGERLVMTNGCFDILHAGHVAYLEEAKSLGDRLIVAVNDDASVARLKGPARPVIPLEDRMAVLAGLAAVDWVVPFSGDTPEGLITRILPQILVKGGDYRVEEIAGGDAVLRSGGEVRVLAFRPGRSSSAVIAAIRSGEAKAD